MGYTKSAYTEAREILSKRAQYAKDLAAKHLTEIYTKIPEIKKIDNELAGTVVEIQIAIAKGKEGIEERIAHIQANNLALQEKRQAILKENGYPENYTKVNYECPICEDTGFTLKGECQCLKRELSRITIKNSGLGHLVEKQSFENFDLKYYTASPKEFEMMKHNLEYLKVYAAAFNVESSPNLLFVGATGLGKTHLSTAIAKEIISLGNNVVYETAQNILSDFEDEKFRKDYISEEKGAHTKKYFECDLLIIDDLGTELTNSFTLSVLYNLINTRVNSKKPMIISTNLMSKDIAQRYDQRITSRLLGEFEPVLFYGTDIRMQKLN